MCTGDRGVGRAFKPAIGDLCEAGIFSGHLECEFNAIQSNRKTIFGRGYSAIATIHWLFRHDLDGSVDLSRIDFDFHECCDS